MSSVPPDAPAVSPLLQAALLIAAFPHMDALGIPHPTAVEVCKRLGVSRSRAYELCRAITAVLPSLQRPTGRPANPVAPPPADAGVVSIEMLAFMHGHPGASVRTETRHTYSDGLRHHVIELAEQHPDLTIAQLAAAIGIPEGTVQDWLRAPSRPVLSTVPEAAVPQPIPANGDLRNARIASVVDAWSRWHGKFGAFCAFVRDDLAIDYRETLIGRILAVHAGRRTQSRKGRSSDEKAMRGALVSFFGGAQWFEDGSPIDIELNGRKFTFNWELVIDGFSGALVGCSVRPEEDAVAVVEAFNDATATTGAKPLAINTDNYAANHAPEVEEALGDTGHIRTTLGRPQTDAPVEGAFGLFRQTAPPLVVHGRTDEELARAILALFLTVWARATNHRPRNDRRGRTRVQLYADELPTDEQIIAAKAALEERRRLQELAFRTRQARLDPIVRALLDEAFDRLGFDDPTGNVRDAIAGYPYNIVLAGIATFEGKRDAGTLPADAGPRYLLGIVKRIAERNEGLAIAERLWRMRLAAQDRALTSLEEARRATTGTAREQVRAFVDQALAGDGPLLRGFWLAAASDLVRASPENERHGLFVSAARRIQGTFRVDHLDRQAAVRFLGEHVLPVA
jgi:hypothetical protein